MQNKPNVKSTKNNVNSVITMRYENMDIWLFRKTNPIQTQSKPIKANFNAKQTQTNPILSHFGREKLFWYGPIKLPISIPDAHKAAIKCLIAASRLNLNRHYGIIGHKS